MAEVRQFGAVVAGWQEPLRPLGEAMVGRLVRLEPMNPDLHAADLHRAYSGHDRLWDYLPYGPFASASTYHRWAKDTATGPDPLFLVVRDSQTGRCGGVASYLRITPASGSIEVGHICLAPEMQRSPAATEAMYLMMAWAFDAGYRRYEWKCDALNLPSRRAAQRLGFSYEGIFRQATIVKGRNRDTAWFAVIDAEWSALREAYRAWLAPANFDAEGCQRERLSDLTRLVRVADDPVLSR
ncbi:MAG: GNAT family protein [Pseudorhodobacter sp.]|nr:GNAT family protein [Pseudorhodobacter sp.]